MSKAANRKASVTRKTNESDVRVEIDLDGSGAYDVSTGVPFLDHMLQSFARHALFDLRLAAKGDLEVDTHHTVEDVGITLGQALREALGTAEGIRRYGSAVIPMSEAKVEVSIDVSNRPYLVYAVELANTRIGSFDASLAEDFFYAFSQNAGARPARGPPLRTQPPPRGGGVFQGTGARVAHGGGARPACRGSSHGEGGPLNPRCPLPPPLPSSTMAPETCEVSPRPWNGPGWCPT